MSVTLHIVVCAYKVQSQTLNHLFDFYIFSNYQEYIKNV
jgi:hypothetical protein